MTKKEITLNAQTRNEKNGKGRQLRAAGFIPAVVYGPDSDNLKIKIPYNEFESAFRQAGESTLIELNIDNEKGEKVLIKDYQTNSIKGHIIHVDFYKVKMGEEMTTEVPLNFINDSRVVKEEGGLLVKNIESVEITCLPNNLPNHIDVDLSQIKTFDDQINLKDLVLPEKVELTTEEDYAVVSAIRPKEEEEEEEEAGEEAKEGEGKEGGEEKEASEQ
ncbi:MAG: 50S ribosomal protein L25 [Patescibacteria group bacterium]